MMMTRCPACTTTFRVTSEQLKARHGQVRCGRCQHVFDAIEFMVETPGVAIENALLQPTPEAELDLAPVPEPISTERMEAIPEAAETTVAEHADDSQEADDPATEEAELEAPSKPDLDSVLRQPLPSLSPLSDGYLKATEKGRQPQWPWAVAAMLALAMLAAQVLVAFRVDLAAYQPGMRPLLEALCVYTECTVELPSNPNLISIESSDLHPAPQHKGGLELTATLKNRAPHPQLWPHLELTLTDGADKPIVRRVLGPDKFLPREQSAASGFAANAELAVQLVLDPGDLPAAGYRLYLFYP